MPQKPLITIGIISFNAEDTISRAIDSALDQTWENREVLIVDDSSTDGTVQIIKDYQSKHKEVRFISHAENHGVAYMRQLLLDQACGEYIAFFDDDDYSFPDRLENQYGHIVSNQIRFNSDRMLCYGDRVRIEGAKTPQYVNAIGRGDVVPQGEIVARSLLLNERPPPFCWGELGAGTMMGPVKPMKNLGFNQKFRRGAEIDLAVRASLEGFYFIAVPKPVIEQYVTNAKDKRRFIRILNRLRLIYNHNAYLLENKILVRAYFIFFTTVMRSGIRVISKRIVAKSSGSA